VPGGSAAGIEGLVIDVREERLTFREQIEVLHKGRLWRHGVTPPFFAFSGPRQGRDVNVTAEYRSAHTPQEGLVDLSIDSASVLQIATKMKIGSDDQGRAVNASEPGPRGQETE
jgi:hypothetical protein